MNIKEDNYTGVFHEDDKLNDMLHQMVSHNDAYRLVYRWIVQRQLSFREFMDLMKTYERMIRN
jgi:hypothetical protein